jgi:hypothetical protein
LQVCVRHHFQHAGERGDQQIDRFPIHQSAEVDQFDFVIAACRGLLVLPCGEIDRYLGHHINLANVGPRKGVFGHFIGNQQRLGFSFAGHEQI